MMNLICKENEGKKIIVSTEEFNEWLKENDIEWTVIVDYHGGFAMNIENGSDKHESFEFVMYKKFDIDLKEFRYAKIDGETYPSRVELKFEFYKHNDVYFELLNDTTAENRKYAERVRTEYKAENINSVEASHLLFRRDISPAYWL